MNRELKFRAWNHGEKKFIDHDRLFGTGAYFNDPFSRLDIDLQQFTGLLDKNGVEIYEGDIVRYVDKSYEVYWTNGHFMGCNELWLDKDLQVIGNIYEHSHLLKQT